MCAFPSLVVRGLEIPTQPPPFLFYPPIASAQSCFPRPTLDPGERNKQTPWRPPGSPTSTKVVATAVAAAAAAAAAMARPSSGARRRHGSNASRGAAHQDLADRQRGSAPSAEDDFCFASRGGDRDGDGDAYGAEKSPRSPEGAYAAWLAGERYASALLLVPAVTTARGRACHALSFGSRNGCIGTGVVLISKRAEHKNKTQAATVMNTFLFRQQLAPNNENQTLCASERAALPE